jgi:hypothetical protein
VLVQQAQGLHRAVGREDRITQLNQNIDVGRRTSSSSSTTKTS